MSNGSEKEGPNDAESRGETSNNFRALLVIALVGLPAIALVAVFIANQLRPKNQAANPAITIPAVGLTIDHPPTLLLARSGETVEAAGVIPACDPGFDYCLYVPGGTHSGTNFVSAGLRVTLRPEISSRLSCLAAQPDGFSGLQPAVRDSERHATSRFGDVGQGAAGSISHGELRRLYLPGQDGGGTCTEFELRVAHSQFANHPAGSITEFGADEVTQVMSSLEDVLAGVRLADGERVAWPTKGSSSMEAFIRVDSLAQVGRVSSPIRVEGVATGAWFFEGSFPLRLETAAGEHVADGFATAKSDWMTTELVPFLGEIAYQVAELTRATLVLERDNPSDLPEHDASLRIELELLP